MTINDLTLSPSPGHFLTQADDTLAMETRIIASRLQVPNTEAVAQWREIDEDAAAALRAAIDEAIATIPDPFLAEENTEEEEDESGALAVL